MYCDPQPDTSESALYDRLHQLQLSHWIVVYARLATHTRGLECVMDHHPPLQQLLAVVDAVAHCTPQWRERLMLTRLARLPLFYYQVRCNAGSRWFVLRESYTDFGHRTGEVRIWHDFDPCPDPETVEHWIRQCLATTVKT